MYSPQVSIYPLDIQTEPKMDSVSVCPNRGSKPKTFLSPTGQMSTVVAGDTRGTESTGDEEMEEHEEFYHLCSPLPPYCPFFSSFFPIPGSELFN